jgi:gentisate 1,2-dioxygenase
MDPTCQRNLADIRCQKSISVRRDERQVMTDTTQDMDQLFADAAEKHAFPFWTRVEAVRPNEPQAKASPNVWHYADMRALLEQARDLVVGEHAAERRVFILANPAMDPRYTTDGVLAALQLLLPGEIASSHRHTASAIRFVIEGEGAYTQVGGAKMHMVPGDLVLTPSLSYHDHGNEGNEAVVWLDALDLPLFHMIPANFSNHYKAAQYPAIESPESPLIFHWSDMKTRLDAIEGTTAIAEYRNRLNGGPILNNLRASAMRLDAGARSAPVTETASGVYQVVSGSGVTTVGATELRWSTGDVFAVPAWTRYQHVNVGSAAAYLFRIDEHAALEKLGMYVADRESAA